MLLASENTFGVCLSRLHLAHSDLEVTLIPGNDSMHVMHVGELRAAMSLWKDCIFAWTPRCSRYVVAVSLTCAAVGMLSLHLFLQLSAVAVSQTCAAVVMFSCQVFLQLSAIAVSQTCAAVGMLSLQVFL